MGNPDRMNDGFDLTSPMVKELCKPRKSRRFIERLPGEGLQQARMIRHTVEYFRSEQVGTGQASEKVRVAVSHSVSFLRLHPSAQG